MVPDVLDAALAYQKATMGQGSVQKSIRSLFENCSIK